MVGILKSYDFSDLRNLVPYANSLLAKIGRVAAGVVAQDYEISENLQSRACLVASSGLPVCVKT